MIIDFAEFPVGQSCYLTEAAAQNVGVAGPTPRRAADRKRRDALRRGREHHHSRHAADSEHAGRFASYSDADCLPPSGASRPNFRSSGRMHAEASSLINELAFDENRVDHVVLKGSTEEWELKNDVITSNWIHPVHIHFEEGRIMQRTRRVDVGLPTQRRVNVPL